VVTTIALVVGASAYAMWSRSGFHLGSYFRLDGKSPLSRAILILTLLLASCLPLAYIFAPPSDAIQDNSGLLPWKMFERHCVPPDGSVESCSHFAGARLVGHGTISQFTITKIDNPTEGLAAWLPSPAANWLWCAYGRPYATNCEELSFKADRDACIFNVARGRPCHLHDLDHYTYEVKVLVTTHTPGVNDLPLHLTAADWFRKPAGYIKIGSEVSFAGVLRSDGSPRLSVSLTGFNCTSCSGIMEDLVYQHHGSWHMLVLVINAIHAVWNFFLSPLIIFE
jgi:hypothetical protein